MAQNKSTPTLKHSPTPPGLVEIEAALDSIDDSTILATLQAYRWTGRQGYTLSALWRAYVASFLLNLPHTNALIRQLEDNPGLRLLCGFSTPLPHRTTFNRFIQRLSHHSNLVEAAFVALTNHLKVLLPDLGQDVAVDSTTVRSHSNPNRKHVSDPEASWTAKNSTQAKEGGKEWRHGFKVHMIADVKYGVPLAQIVTTAKRNDSPELPAVLTAAEALYPWFRPATVIGDRGYDARSNHEYLHNKGILPIIHIRRNAQSDLYDDTYTPQGIPVCLGRVPMEYVRSDPEKGHLYRCKGCHLAGSRRGGVRHCDTEIWEDPSKNIRLFGVIRRDSTEWKALYAKRQAIERVFKGMKESRRLERHCVRGLRHITLHALMSSLTYQATLLVRLEAGEAEWMRWMVRKVA